MGGEPLTSLVLVLGATASLELNWVNSMMDSIRWEVRISRTVRLRMGDGEGYEQIRISKTAG